MPHESERLRGERIIREMGVLPSAAGQWREGRVDAYDGEGLQAQNKLPYAPIAPRSRWRRLLEWLDSL